MSATADSFSETVKRDVVHAAALWGLPARRAIPRAIGKVLLYPRVRAVLLFRVSQVLWRRRGGRGLALLLQNHILRSSGAELHPGAEVGPGLNLVHSNGVVIGARTTIGRDARIYQGVTVGDDGKRTGQPTIGSTAVLGAGCRVLGPVRLGDRVVVGANAVVLRDAPCGATLVGVPATVAAGHHTAS